MPGNLAKDQDQEALCISDHLHVQTVVAMPVSVQGQQCGWCEYGHMGSTNTCDDIQKTCDSIEPLHHLEQVCISSGEGDEVVEALQPGLEEDVSAPSS